MGLLFERGRAGHEPSGRVRRHTAAVSSMESIGGIGFYWCVAAPDLPSQGLSVQRPCDRGNASVERGPSRRRNTRKTNNYSSININLRSCIMDGFY